MKYKLLIFIAALLLVTLACGGSADTAEPAEPAAPPTETPLPDWPEFKSETGSFSVLMPELPEEQVQTVPSDAGDMNLYIYMIDKGDYALGVMYNELPDILVGVTDETVIATMLDGGRDGALGNVGGSLVSEEEISINGFPGRHIVFDIPDETISGGGNGVIRIYLTDTHLYQLIALGATGKLVDADVQRFLDSFELTQ